MADDAKVALEAIKADGCAIVVRIITGGTLDPVSDAISGETVTPYATFALIKSYSQRDVDGERIRRGDKLFIVPAANLPRIDKLTGRERVEIEQGGRIWTTQNVDAIEPCGQALLYKVQVR